jgi:hypothetical protein
MMRRIFPLLVAAGVGVAAYKTLVEPWWRTWGVDPDETARALPGDEIVTDGVNAETRGITINAPPSAVWPWLVQMGFGRAGWYSYDVVDMKGSSAAGIRPELQGLALGDIVPTHPGGGFVVKAIEPERHLVLYMDSQLAREQAEAAKAINAESPSNLRVTGAFMETSQPTEFTASWAFVLEDLEDGRTRLIERFRIRFGAADDKPWTRATLPLMGFGLFVMMRRQLLGIRDRAERWPPPEAVAA